jgi:hypothetical protein
MLAPRFPTPRTVPYLTGILAPALSSSRRAHANTFLALPCTKNRSRCQRASQRPSVASARPQQARPSQSVAIASRLTTRDERGEHMRPSGCERWARGKAMRQMLFSLRVGGRKILRNQRCDVCSGLGGGAASVTIRRNPKCSRVLRVLGGARAQGGGTHDSEESTLRRVLRARGEALHRSRFAGIQVLACARSARACSRSGWFWGILVSKFLCIRFCVLILQYQELDSLVPYDRKHVR